LLNNPRTGSDEPGCKGNHSSRSGKRFGKNFYFFSKPDHPACSLLGNIFPKAAAKVITFFLKPSISVFFLPILHHTMPVLPYTNQRTSLKAGAKITHLILLFQIEMLVFLYVYLQVLITSVIKLHFSYSGSSNLTHTT